MPGKVRYQALLEAQSLMRPYIGCGLKEKLSGIPETIPLLRNILLDRN